MILAIVQIKWKAGTDFASAKATFMSTAPKYQSVPGLVRKHYLFDAGRGVGGGAYLFESPEHAQVLYDDVWRKRVEATYDAPADIQFFEVPVTVDNISRTIESA